MSGLNMSLCILVILGLNVVSQTEGLRLNDRRTKYSQAEHDQGNSECPSGQDSLPGDLMTLSWFVYNGSKLGSASHDRNYLTYNKNMDRAMHVTLDRYFHESAGHAPVAKCWHVFENEQDGPRIEGQELATEMAGRMSMINFDRCIIADVYEGTSIQKHKDDKDRIGENRRYGKWLSPLLSVIVDPKRKEFIQQFCGNPTVTHHYGQAFEDHTTEDLMRKVMWRAKQVKNHDWHKLYRVINPKCPNGLNSVTTGHSLGGVLSMMTAYCNNYFYYDLWQKSMSTGVDWPDWVKRLLFYSEVYSFAALQDTEFGSLVDFGALVPGNWRLHNKPLGFTQGADLCWQGARTFFSGDILIDPAPDTFCRQTFDPISSVRMTDTLGHSVKSQCSCPTFFPYGMDRELVMQGLSATPMPCLMSPHERFSSRCNECYETKEEPGWDVHIDTMAYTCGVRAANQKLSEEETSACELAYSDLKAMIVTNITEQALPGKKCKPKGGPSGPGAWNNVR